MKIFFDFLTEYQALISFALLSIVIVMVVVQWVCWIFSLGRFTQPVSATADQRQASSSAQPVIGSAGVDRRIRFVIAELFAKLIDDFRHLLALIIVIIFMMTIIYALWVGRDDIEHLNKALQAVTGSFSGIIGVIIGYYFGESSARVGSETADSIRPVGPPVQSSSPAPQPAPEPAPPPQQG